MKQTELCKRSKVSKSSLSEYLSGKHIPNQVKIFALAKALDVDPVWLWGYDVPMEKKEEPEEIKKSPNELQLTEGEKAFIRLLRRLPVTEQPVVIDRILSELDKQE
jgi:transcriptional regulator with XRE-family HTH domain